MNLKPLNFAIIFTGLLVIGLLIFQLKINDHIKSETKVVKKLDWSQSIVSLERNNLFTVGIADYYYSDLIIPTNQKLDFFYISSDPKVTKITKKDTLPTIKKYSTITYKSSKFLIFYKRWEVEKTIPSFVLSIPKNSIIKRIKKENDFDSIRIAENIVIN